MRVIHRIRLLAVLGIALAAAVVAAPAGAYSISQEGLVNLSAEYTITGDGVTASAITPDGAFLVQATDHNPTTLYYIDAMTGSIIGHATLTASAIDAGASPDCGGQPYAMAMAPAGDFVYVGLKKCIVKVRLSNGLVAGYFDRSTTSRPNGIIEQAAVSPDGQYGYFVDNGTPTHVLKVKLDDMTFVRDDAFPAYGGIFVSPDGTTLYGADANYPSVITKGSATDYATIGTPITTDADGLSNGVMSADGHYAYFTDFIYRGTSTSVVKIDLEGWTQVGAKQVVSGVPEGWAIALSPDGKRLLTANWHTPVTVTEFDTSDMSIASSLEVTDATGATQLQTSPLGQYAYLGTYDSPYKSVLLQYSAANTLTVTTNGEGSGSVTSDVGDIDCGDTCTADLFDYDNVTLTATAAAGSTFAGWSGACSGATATCTLAMSEARDVTATFDAAPAPGPEPSPKPDKKDAVTVPTRILRHGLTASASGRVMLPLVCPNVPGGCDAAGRITALVPSDLATRAGRSPRILARFTGIHIAEGTSKLLTIRLDNRIYQALRNRGITRIRATLLTRNSLSGGTVVKRVRIWLHIAPKTPIRPITG